MNTFPVAKVFSVVWDPNHFGTTAGHVVRDGPGYHADRRPCWKEYKETPGVADLEGAVEATAYSESSRLQRPRNRSLGGEM